MSQHDRVSSDAKTERATHNRANVPDDSGKITAGTNSLERGGGAAVDAERDMGVLEFEQSPGDRFGACAGIRMKTHRQSAPLSLLEQINELLVEERLTHALEFHFVDMRQTVDDAFEGVNIELCLGFVPMCNLTMIAAEVAAVDWLDVDPDRSYRYVERLDLIRELENDVSNEARGMPKALRQPAKSGNGKSRGEAQVSCLSFRSDSE
jgi:hypothetical protein